MNMTNTSPTVKPSDLLDLATIAQATNRFLFIEGSGGVGKTSIVCNLLAPHMGREVYYVNLNGQGPQEVIGYGKPTGDEMEFYAPSIWPTLKRVGNKPVLLFLDECNDYDPAVRALLRSLYPASGNRMVGPHVLGSDVFVVCASNRRQDGTRAAIEDAPFTERCCKVQLVSDVGDWLAWFDTQPALVAGGSHVPAFLKFGISTGEGVDHFNPPVKMPYDGVPHPCPRTWEAVALAHPFRHLKDSFRTFVRGSVGDKAANAYFAFLQHVDRLPDLAALKANPEGFAVPDSAADQYALVSASLTTALVGVHDPEVAVHNGGFDWLVSLLLRCRGDIREYGATSANRRGIPLKEHAKSHQLFI